MDPANIAKSFVSDPFRPWEDPAPTRREHVWTYAELNKIGSWSSYRHSGGQLVKHRDGKITREWVYYYGMGVPYDVALTHIIGSPSQYIKGYPRGVKLTDWVRR
jgi:hypothetical protein